MIYTINSKCGSGKTHWALNEATKLIQNKKRVMIVAPSLDLQNEMSNRLGFTPHFVINYTTNNEGGVATSIANYLKNPPSKYEILIITAAAFVTINKFPNKKKWICFIDEELSVFDNISFNSSDSSNYAFGNDLMNDIEKIADLKLNEEIGFVEFKLKSLPLKEIKFLKSICYGSKAADFVYPPFQKFIQLLLNKNMRVFGDSESIVMFKLGNDTAKMWSELNEQLFLNFQNLYIMGAEIQRSKMVVYLKLKGLKIEPLQIQQRFEYHEQPITIKWFTKHKPWSKSYYNSINEVAGISQFELYDLLVSETIGNEPILLQNNKGNPFKYIQKPIYMNFEVATANGLQLRAAPWPEFSMKGRTLNSMLRLVTAWHSDLAANTPGKSFAWQPSGIQGYRFLEKRVDGEHDREWTIQELLDSGALQIEGRAMRHCVYSYADRCRRGETKIWSLRLCVEGAEKRMVTIEVDPHRRAIVQVRAKCNLFPGNRSREIIRQWATCAGLQFDVEL